MRAGGNVLHEVAPGPKVSQHSLPCMTPATNLGPSQSRAERRRWPDTPRAVLERSGPEPRASWRIVRKTARGTAKTDVPSYREGHLKGAEVNARRQAELGRRSRYKVTPNRNPRLQDTQSSVNLTTPYTPPSKAGPGFPACSR